MNYATSVTNYFTNVLARVHHSITRALDHRDDRRYEYFRLLNEQRFIALEAVRNDEASRRLRISRRESSRDDIKMYKKLCKFSKSLLIPKLMLETPDNVEDWIGVLCPDGKRCCVMAQDSTTQVFFLESGKIDIFQSLLPYGHFVEDYHYPRSHYICTILDCVYSSKLKKFYIIDIIEWTDFPCKKLDADLRFDLLINKLHAIKGINEKSTKNARTFEIAPRMAVEDLLTVLLLDFNTFPNSINLEGIIFFNPNDVLHLCKKDKTILYWLKPFMIQEVFGRPVNSVLYWKPLSYNNISEYNRKLNKKNEKILKGNPKRINMVIKVYGYVAEEHLEEEEDALHLEFIDDEEGENETEIDSAIDLDDIYEWNQ